MKDKDGNIRGVTFTDSKRHVTYAGSKIDRSLSFAKIDKQMFNVVYLDDHQGDETLQFQPKEEKPFDISETFNFSKISDGTQQPSDDGYSDQQTTGSDGGASSGSNIGEAIAEVLLQPNVAPTSGGGGGGASGGWRDDDDDEKNKNNYRPRRKGR